MAKYKLEYIWLDGYKPVPNLRGKTQIKEFDSISRARTTPDLGLRRQLHQAGRRPQLGLHAQAGRAFIPTASARTACSCMCEVMMPDGKTPHPSNTRATILDDAGRLVRFRAGIFPLQGRPPARLSRRRRLSGAARSVLHRRRLQERRRYRPRDRGGASRPLPRRRHQPRRHQRRSGQGPVGIPDLRQRLQEGRRRDVDGALPAAASLRKIRHGRRVPLQAARRTPTGTAPACTPTSRPSYMREIGGKEYFESADGGVRQVQETNTSPSMDRTITCA